MVASLESKLILVASTHQPNVGYGDNYHNPHLDL
ncbi:uncharacterized protein METZ01_LOCUS325891 [marine metagenome]|uniref:Uncharacterized protein n=1 Tax=marine metagenome TaxID=408172 RepID=A0A382PJK6_9ZZZZ